VALKNLALLLGSLVFAFALAEGTVRVIGETDADGQFIFRGAAIPPYRLRVHALVAAVERYRAADSKRRTEYDPLLGWAPRAGHQGKLYDYNSDGIRSEVEFERSPRSGMLRIATFGDSFTHCDEVANADCWDRALEAKLAADGIPAEVLNFGMSAYGMDQAFLRWRLQGRAYQPDIVLFGFSPVDIPRNINILRGVLHPMTGMPLSKPRFILEDGKLVLVNSPTVPPDEMPDFVRHFRDHPLARYEGHSADVSSRSWWAWSRLLSLLRSRLVDPQRNRLLTAADASRMTLAIVRAFGAEVEADGGTFVIAHLMSRSHVEQILRGRRPGYMQLLDQLGEEYPVLDAAQAFRSVQDHHFERGGHYSPRANRLVGESLAAQLEACIEAGPCRPRRADWDAQVPRTGSPAAR
jgi:hypothetical protein